MRSKRAEGAEPQVGRAFALMRDDWRLMIEVEAFGEEFSIRVHPRSSAVPSQKPPWSPCPPWLKERLQQRITPITRIFVPFVVSKGIGGHSPPYMFPGVLGGFARGGSGFILVPLRFPARNLRGLRVLRG